MNTDITTPPPAEGPAFTDSPLTRALVYATFNARMFAAVIDLTVIMIIAYPLTQRLVNLFYPPVDLDAFAELYKAPHTQDELTHSVWNLFLSQHVFELIILNNIFQLAFTALYILPFWIYSHTTPGKFLAGIEIRDAATNGFMTRRQAFKRFGAYILSGIPLAIGFVAMILNRRRQAWHDKMANTVVVQKERRLISLKPRSGGR